MLIFNVEERALQKNGHQEGDIPPDESGML